VPLLPIRLVAPIPWFIMVTFAVAALPCRRAARTSVQRLFLLLSVPLPSVMESPIATTPTADASAMTSMSEM
jgi:hypothetical protein